MARPGTPAKDIYNLALDIAKTNGLEEYFMGHRQQAGFVGHGVGIEINELPVLAPRSRDILAEGMTFALEPKFVIPGVGAVGIENTFVVTADGLEQLTICDEVIKELR
jgi:Xaa-Pro aminopeptidase